MFTSRAELRLLFRIDNADERLTPLGREIGLVDDARWARFREKYASLARLQAYIREKTVNRSTPGWDGLPEAVRAAAGDGKALAHLVKMPEIRLRDLRPVLEGDGMAVHPLLLDQAEHDCKYAGYIRLQSQDLERLARRKALTIPPGFDFESIPSLSREMRDRLRRYRPASLLEAESIPGFTPAALTALYLSLEVLHHASGKGPGAPAQEASE
jgi:tRNA uridine 5-carboxymethylaminomethyl modification enzyme